MKVVSGTPFGQPADDTLPNLPLPGWDADGIPARVTNRRGRCEPSSGSVAALALRAPACAGHDTVRTIAAPIGALVSPQTLTFRRLAAVVIGYSRPDSAASLRGHPESGSVPLGGTPPVGVNAAFLWARPNRGMLVIRAHPETPTTILA